MDPIELVAVVLGLASVVLTMRQSLWCWPTGIANVLLFAFVFFQARLYSDVILQGVYVGVQAWGWWKWTHGGDPGAGLPVSRIGRRQAYATLAVGLVGTAGWGALMATCTNAAAPFADAGIAVWSLVAQAGLGKKILENWLVWICVDVLAVVVYMGRGLYLTSGLYAVFLVLATLGWQQWKRTLAQPAAA